MFRKLTQLITRNLTLLKPLQTLQRKFESEISQQLKVKNDYSIFFEYNEVQRGAA